MNTSVIVDQAAGILVYDTLKLYFWYLVILLLILLPTFYWRLNVFSMNLSGLFIACRI